MARQPLALVQPREEAPTNFSSISLHEHPFSSRPPCPWHRKMAEPRWWDKALMREGIHPRPLLQHRQAPKSHFREAQSNNPRSHSTKPRVPSFPPPWAGGCKAPRWDKPGCRMRSPMQSATSNYQIFGHPGCQQLQEPEGPAAQSTTAKGCMLC